SSRLRRRPASTLFPYTTLFRSDVLPARLQGELGDAFGHGGVAEGFTGVGVDRDHVRFAGGERGRTGAVLGEGRREVDRGALDRLDRKSTRLNSSHVKISYAVFC